MKVFKPVAMLVLVLALTACNTMAGVGKDVQSAGDAVEDAAHDCHDANRC